MGGAKSYAQTKEWGSIGVGIESSFGFYHPDRFLSSNPDQKFGTNTFINLDYMYKGFRAGLQYDIFEPPMVGYDPSLKGNGPVELYASYSDSKFDVTLGTFSEQFGSGLLFRAYEQRDMGINTSVLGTKFRYAPTSWIAVKYFAGLPRRFMAFPSSPVNVAGWAESFVTGADLEFDPLLLINPEASSSLKIAGSWVLRDDFAKDRKEDVPAVCNGFSARADYISEYFNVGAEFVHKGRGMRNDPYNITDVACGKALLLNAGVNASGRAGRFSANLSVRSFENLSWHQSDLIGGKTINLNFIPSLTKQHKYALSAIYVHKVRDYGGETGAQLDLFYSIPIGSDKRRPLMLSANAAYYSAAGFNPETLKYSFMSFTGDLLFAEASFEAKKKLSKQWEATAAFSWQRLPHFYDGFGDVMTSSEVVVADVIYKPSRKLSFRMELQHAWSNSPVDQAWAMGLLEVGISPGWMIYCSDMVNYKTINNPVHYFDFGFSYSYQFVRLSLSYGRHREGETCSGGVCRYVPEYTGVNFIASLTF